LSISIQRFDEGTAQASGIGGAVFERRDLVGSTIKQLQPITSAKPESPGAIRANGVYNSIENSVSFHTEPIQASDSFWIKLEETRRASHPDHRPIGKRLMERAHGLGCRKTF
jgi:hypothetical protein